MFTAAISDKCIQDHKSYASYIEAVSVRAPKYSPKYSPNNQMINSKWQRHKTYVLV
jgi:hypothetical protein